MRGRHNVLLRVVRILYTLAIVLLASWLIGQVFSVKNTVPRAHSDLRVLSLFEYSVNGEDKGAVQLPTTFDNLKPNDMVVLRGTIEARRLNSMLINVKGAFFKLYLNDDTEPYYEVGSPGSYPSFQKEPPSVVTSVALPESPKYLDLRLEYTVPEIRSSLTLSELYIGDKDLILPLLINHEMIILVFSGIMVIAAFIFVIIRLMTLRRAAEAGAFIWLGLTCFAASTWILCSNSIILYLIPLPAFFYNFCYVGLFAMVPAFMHFNRSVLTSRSNRFISALSYFSAVVFVASFVLHLSGFISFAQLSPYLYIAGPLMLVAFAAAVLLEHFRYKNPLTGRYLFACSMFALMTIIELLNSGLLHIVSSGLFFLVGLAFFVFELTLIIWEYLNEAVDATEENRKLQDEIESNSRAMSAQRSLYETLVTSNEEVRKIRHDMRHQVSVARGYLEEGRNEEAIKYLDEVYGAAPKMGDLLLCDNFAINALASHYRAIAQEKKIQVDLRFVVPEKVGRVPDSELSIIVGNLFENAIEACGHVDEHKRFIKLQSSVDERRFMLVIDNSYDGYLDMRGKDFYSRKRVGRGTGMSSVRAVVKKYDGSMKYETADGIFKISLYLKI